MSNFAIAGRAVGPDQPPYIIAEMSANHNGDKQRALQIVKAAKDAGADAVKLQTYTADTITLDADGPDFQISDGLWQGRRLYDLYDEAHTPWDWHYDLFAYGRELGITVFSSPFDDTAVDFLEGLGAPAYKVASFEVVDIPLVERIARTGKPMIMSTGMANPTEIGEALEAARANGAQDIVLLHCVSGYPTPFEESHLYTIPDLAQRFGTHVGLSDHSFGTAVPVAATALGATVIEKHVTLRRADGGPDSIFSLEPEELESLVTNVRNAWKALGPPDYSQKGSEQASAQFRRSLYAVADIAEGEVLTRANVRSIRPGYGLAPKHLKSVLGCRARRAIPRGTPLAWELLSN